MIHLFRLAGLATAVVIRVLSVVPGELRPHVLASGQLEHFGAYCVVGLVLGLGYWDRAPILLIGAGLGVYFGLLETAQPFIPGRHSSVIDFGASSLGALSGTLLVLLLGSVVRDRAPFRRRSLIGNAPRGRHLPVYGAVPIW